ncbi:hypothetical protein AAAK29_20580 [Mesorhizobium sp. CCNWLW179-1]|uniref:hypothetical protein n=1 Tax=unclassified Mesorhizobium TaxID=325217 RepID=UPI0030151869
MSINSMPYLSRDERSQKRLLVLGGEPLAYLKNNAGPRAVRVLIINCNRQIRLSEPPELNFPHETPTVLPELLEAHIQQLGYSVADLAGLLHVQPQELSVLYGLTLTREQKAAHLRIIK